MRGPVASAAGVFILLAGLARCSGSTPSAPSGGGGGGGGSGGGIGGSSVTLYAAGDIGECGFGTSQTGALLDNLPGGLILAVGDLAYPGGSATDFHNCYDPFWGRHKARTRPVPGNHEYENPAHSADPYFDYFGDLAGTRGQGYYAFTASTWRVIALNSEIDFGPGSAQLVWLRSELSNNRTACTLVYWHRGLFSSGPDGNQPDTKNLWTTLTEFNADVVLNGHDHEYERFAPQDPDGKASATGIREFIIGTGGAHLYTPVSLQPNSQVRASTYGIFILTLTDNAYAWDFAAAGSAFRDTGSDACH
jgi:hypothetical protein